MDEINSLLYQIIQVNLGYRVMLERTPSADDWKAIYAVSQKQTVAGFVLSAIERLMIYGQQPSKKIILEWIGLSEKIRIKNQQVCLRCISLEKKFVNAGYKCCVLKGQGTALYYENPLCRQSGDIDLWVTKNGHTKVDDVREDVLEFAKENGYKISQIDIKHSDIEFFKDVPVEVHFMPSWMFNPFKNRKLQKYFAEHANKQFENFDANIGFTHTTVDFDLVFSLVHIYRHVFEEGIGLRQLLDYYHILLHSDVEQRNDAYKVLKEFGMSSFAGGVMWVMMKCFAMKDEYYLCEVNERHGSFLLSEIMIAGNFGHYDERIQRIDKNKHFKLGFIQLKRNLKFVSYYPSEVLWSPFWKLWHWCWRKKKGYL